MTIKIQPFFHEIPYEDPLKLFALFADKPWSMLLHSARTTDAMGRYSFIMIDPFKTIISENNGNNPWLELKQQLSQYSLQALPELPPFQGGMAGYFSYELNQYLEKIPYKKIDNLNFPLMAVGFYNLVISFDHEKKQAWVFSSHENEKIRSQRLVELLQQLEEIPELCAVSNPAIKKNKIHSNFSINAYQAAVNKVREYIYAGDIFQANLAQRFSVHLPEDFNFFNLYRKLVINNPAPFASYLNCEKAIIVSASPERFLKLDNNKVETRPIKGTQKRGKTALEDAVLAHQLKVSSKDRAENIMIVDLMRNDLSRVCEAGSIKVPQLCELESFATVHHLVSVVTGKLKTNLTAVDLLTASFPGGSITGAPKVRAMEIIAEIEPDVRGPYCGCIGYIGFDGNMDSAITIRTFAIKDNVLTFHAGGGIVADSKAVAEYEETLHKAQALFDTLCD